MPSSLRSILIVVFMLTPTALMAQEISPIQITQPSDEQVTRQVSEVTGQVVAGHTLSQVTLYNAQDKSVLTYNPTVDLLGKWVVPLQGLKDGDYVLQARVVDMNQEDVDSQPVHFTIDTISPTLSLTSPSHQERTNLRDLGFKGEVSSDATVTMRVEDKDGNTLYVGNPNSGEGFWGTVVNTLSDGVYTVHVFAQDKAGNRSDLPPATFTIDRTAPGVELNAPAHRSLLAEKAPMISGIVDANEFVKVRVLDEQGKVRQVLQPKPDANGVWHVTPEKLRDGKYTLWVDAFDDLGNMTTKGPVSVEIDTTPPALRVDRPAKAPFLGYDEMIVDGWSEPGQKVSFEIKGEGLNQPVIRQPVADVEGYWRVELGVMREGEYTVAVAAQDEAGNAAQWGHQFFLDRRNAFVELGNIAPEGAVSKSRVLFEGRKSQDAILNVVLRQNNEVVLQTSVDNPQTRWEVEPNFELADGKYSVWMEASMPNGKKYETTTHFHVDTVAPTLVVKSPGVGAVVPKVTTAIEGRTEPYAKLTVFVKQRGQEVWKGLAIASDDGSWKVTAQGLRDGAYDVVVESVDLAGNRAPQLVQPLRVDSIAPFVRLDAMGDVKGVVRTLKPRFTGQAEPGSVVTVLLNGAPIGVFKTPDNGAWWIDAPSNLKQGEHAIKVLVRDEANHVSSSGVVPFEVNLIDPLSIHTSKIQGQLPTDLVSLSGRAEPDTTVVVTLGKQLISVESDRLGIWKATFEDVDPSTNALCARTQTQESCESVAFAQGAQVDGTESRELIGTAGDSAGGCSSVPGEENKPGSGALGWLILGVCVGWRRLRGAKK